MPVISEPPPRRAATGIADIRAWVVNEVARTTHVDPSTVDTTAPLETLGVDSLGAIGMTGALAAWLDRDLPATLLWDYNCIDSLALALADSGSAGQPIARPGVIGLQPLGDAVPLFCFPGMLGHPTTFAPLASHLGTDQPCFGLVVPGLHGEQPPLPAVKAIAAAMIHNIRLVQPTGPYQLAGYSFGGMLAFEAAQQLTAAGEKVSLLAIYDTFAPGGRVKRPGWQCLAIRAQRWAKTPRLPGFVRRRLFPGVAPETSRRQREDQQLADQTGIANAFIAAVRTANWHASMAYVPQMYPGQVVLFRATARSPYSQFYKLDRTNGWQAFSQQPVRVIPTPGSHYRLLDPQHAATAAGALAPFLLGVPMAAA
jgi:thioesterase domain-containing protein/acyl carrier protein